MASNGGATSLAAPTKGLGQFQDLLAQMPADLVHVVLRTPLGVAIVDPFAAAQDARTQQIMQALGVQVEIRFGPVAQADLEAPKLGEALATLGLVVGGGLLVWMLARGR